MNKNLTLVATGLLLLLGVGWLAHVLSISSEGMIGDRFGYDPGTRFLPFAAGLVFVLALMVELWRQRAVIFKAAFPKPNRDVVSHIAALAAYAVFLHTAGFVLATSLFLMALIAINQRHGAGGFAIGQMMIWSGGVAVSTVALYSVLRGAVRLEYWAARAYGLPLLREPAVQTAVSSVLLALILAAAGWGLKRAEPRRLALAAQTSVGVTFALYVIFRQLFFVRLPAGLLFW